MKGNNQKRGRGPEWPGVRNRLIPGRIRGGKWTLTVPADKSISHRALILASLAGGRTTITNLSTGRDVASTASCLKRLGIKMRMGKSSPLECIVEGGGGRFREPSDVLRAGNSGTTMRLLTGLLAGRPFYSVITGDSSLRKRPMARVVEPLKGMGAGIWGRANNGLPPLSIRGGRLRGIRYTSSVSSAQVKTALMLAMFEAEGVLEYREPSPSRDHTERLFQYLGIESKWGEGRVSLPGFRSVEPFRITIPGDISSAIFFIVLTTIIEGMEITLKGVGLNPTRCGALKVLSRMGADIRIVAGTLHCGERVGDIVARYGGRLEGVEISGDIIPSLIDEIPALSVAAAFARGKTRVHGVEELRVKESDRIASIVSLMNAFGVGVREFEDGFEIEGKERLEGAGIDSRGDHRIAMAGAIMASAAEGESMIQNAAVADISFPGFFDTLRSIW